MNWYPALFFAFTICIFIKCTSTPSDNQAKDLNMVNIEQSHYGTTTEGDSIDQFVLRNAKGMEVKVITYGGIITDWTAANKEGEYENIVLGYDSLAQYETGSPYFGSIIGRYSNRIAKGVFSIDGVEYKLAVNNPPNHLHGGDRGFDKVVWKSSTSKTDSSASLILSYVSADGEEGYPGKLTTEVTYTLRTNNELAVAYQATTTKKTVVNMTQHSYFNLTGVFSKPILDHEIMLNASNYLPVDNGLIPTGEIAKVEGTPFDFRKAKAIGLEIDSKNDQIAIGKGYDHCWIFDGDGQLRRVASAHDPSSGRVLEILSTEPAVQFYTGNFLDGTFPMRGDGFYQYRTGFCLETQHYPDSPNQSAFPSTILEPGDTYKSETRFKFSVK